MTPTLNVQGDTRLYPWCFTVDIVGGPHPQVTMFGPAPQDINGAVAHAARSLAAFYDGDEVAFTIDWVRDWFATIAATGTRTSATAVTVTDPSGTRRDYTL